MGDRTAFQFTAPGLDGLSEKRKRKLAGLLDEVTGWRLGEFPQSGFDSLPTDRWSIDTWQWTEVSCGVVDDTGVSGFARILKKLRKWGLEVDDDVKIWESPKYEWLGSTIFTANGVIISTECDDDGTALLLQSEIPDWAPDSYEALGRFVAEHFGIEVRSPSLDASLIAADSVAMSGEGGPS